MEAIDAQALALRKMGLFRAEVERGGGSGLRGCWRRRWGGWRGRGSSCSPAELDPRGWSACTGFWRGAIRGVATMGAVVWLRDVVQPGMPFPFYGIIHHKDFLAHDPCGFMIA